MVEVFDDTGGTIPKEIMIAINQDWYNGSTDNNDRFASVTMLLLPPKIFWGIRDASKRNLKIPASTMMYALEGHINHYLFEKVFEQIPDYDSEYDVRVDYKVDGKIYTITGHSDLIKIKDGLLVDWKNMSYAKYLMDNFTDYEAQTNMYAYLINVMLIRGMTKHQINKIKLVIKLRDWSAMELIKGTKGYPKTMFVEKYLRMWKPAEARAFIDHRIRMLSSFENYPIDSIPECSPEDRWQKQTTYPVFKLQADGTVKAKARACSGTTKFVSPESGNKWIADRLLKKDKASYTIVKRSTFPTRCHSYCDVARYGTCNWWSENKSKYLKKTEQE